MSTFKLEKMLDKVDNKYMLTVIAAKRARVLNDRSFDFDTKSTFRKATSIGLEEVLEGKVKLKAEDKKKAK